MKADDLRKITEKAITESRVANEQKYAEFLKNNEKFLQRIEIHMGISASAGNSSYSYSEEDRVFQETKKLKRHPCSDDFIQRYFTSNGFDVHINDEDGRITISWPELSF